MSGAPPTHLAHAPYGDDPIRRLARRTAWIFAAASLVSLLLHVVSLIKLPTLRDTATDDSHRVKIRLVDRTPEELKVKKDPDAPKADPTKLLETLQKETAKPDVATYAGAVNHQTEKETKTKRSLADTRGKNAGAEGNPDAPPVEAPVVKERPTNVTPQANPKTAEIKVTGKTGTLGIATFKPDRIPRNQYEALLPTSVSDITGQIDAGYQEYIDDKMSEGDRIDINTSEYRYIGYFTAMRKAIELVWNYPSEASRRGMQGEVGLEFVINKDGRTSHIKVVKSSGFQVLDKAIVDAIKLASPFSPLPEGFGREKIEVVGSFRYILTAYGSH